MNGLFVDGSKNFRQVVTELVEVAHRHNGFVSFHPPVMTLTSGEKVEFEMLIRIKKKPN